MGPLPNDAEVLERAAAVAARPEYARFRQLHYRWLEELMDRFSGFLAQLGALRVSSPGAYWALLLGLVLLLLLLTAHIVWTLRAALRDPSSARSPEPEAQRESFAQRAEVLARQEAYLEAAHQLLLASLEHVARRQLVRLRPEDSNRRVRAKILASPLPAGVRQGLVQLIADTEAHWFGKRAAGIELYQRWQETLGQLKSQA